MVLLVGTLAVAVVIVAVALPAAVVVPVILGLSCEALCVLARSIYLDMQQFAQHLFLHNSCAVSHAKVSCLSEPEICMD